MLFVSCTKLNHVDFWETSPLGISLNRLKMLYPTSINTHIFYENARGLSECYNQILDRYASNIQIVFMHDDVYINDMFIIDKIEKGFETADVVGVAGASKVYLRPHERNAWNICNKEDKTGIIYHTTQDAVNDYNNIYLSYFGHSNMECAVMDGVFLAVNRQKIKNIRFDERFAFDGYDMDFCLTCKKNGLKLKTIPLILTHCSHGAGLLSDEYIKMSNIMYNKWATSK